MIRLNFIVEGQTEQLFVHEVLKNHLSMFKVYPYVRRVETGRNKGIIYRGGMTGYLKAKKDITNWMKEDKDPHARFTTMFDLYALPSTFPKFDESKKISNPYKRVETLEYAFQEDIKEKRFIPYVQLHEFEALLLSAPDIFTYAFPEFTSQISRLKEMTKLFTTPEHINDKNETAPSKRIIKEIPEYADLKTTAGPLIAKHIGLKVMREKCLHFNQWVNKLERLDNK
ncbi:hypothetical protein MHK_006193 [Candidatus Magnetomorum sp. HK-1]|nr:hypothetical protein MHK_006193 [Candidatus Magnetomorum sp. HK-1]